ncbi:hypothetical protein HYQ46_005782 [Verticillium longisporum]|nr:hypothetical protein HYQ46_005782 [Verticillium longisporum]
MLLQLGFLRLNHSQSLGVHLLGDNTVADLLDDHVVNVEHKLVGALLCLVGVHEVSSGNGGAVGFVSQTHIGDDNARMQGVVVALDTHPQIKLAATLDQLCVVQLLVYAVGEGTVLDFLVAIHDIGDFVEEVRRHETDASLGGGAHGAQLRLVLDGEGDLRKRWGDVGFLHILAYPSR